MQNDTASVLLEAIWYIRFLHEQVELCSFIILIYLIILCSKTKLFRACG